MQRIDIVKIKLEKEKCLWVENKKIIGSKTAAQILEKYLDGIDREHLVIMGLNTKNFVNIINTVSIGSLNSSIVHPREVLKPVILGNCASFIMGHNHPSGDSTPSKEDITITNRIKECGRILGIELLDHIIIGSDEYSSLKELGHM